MHFPHRGCVRTRRTLYVYTTGNVRAETQKDVVIRKDNEQFVSYCEHSYCG